MHKNKALPERPKPPPFDEIIHDIEKCPDDDVVFSSYFPSGDVSNDGEKSMAMVESYLEDLSDNSSAETPEDEAYRQAVQFVKLQRKLENVPKQLEEQFKRLQELETEVSKSINELKESSEALKDKS